MKLLSAFWDKVDSLLPYLPYFVVALGLYSFYRGYKQWKSGSAQYDSSGRMRESDERVNWFTVGANIFGIILIIAAIAIKIGLWVEK